MQSLDTVGTWIFDLHYVRKANNKKLTQPKNRNFITITTLAEAVITVVLAVKILNIKITNIYSH